MAYTIPTISNDAPAAGKFVRESLTGYSISHALYLPPDWTVDSEWPCIIEMPPTNVSHEETKLMWLNRGQDYVLCAMGWVNADDASFSSTWWQDESQTTFPEHSVTYFKALVAHLQTTYNVVADKTLLAGFSRGGRFPQLIGAYDETTRAAWAGALVFAGWDDGNDLGTASGKWGDAYDRAKNIDKRPVLGIVGLADVDTGGKAKMEVFESHMIGSGNPYDLYHVPELTHNDSWALADTGENFASYVSIAQEWLGAAVTPATTRSFVQTSGKARALISYQTDSPLRWTTASIGGSECRWNKERSAFYVPDGLSAGPATVEFVSPDGTTTYTDEFTVVSGIEPPPTFGSMQSLIRRSRWLRVAARDDRAEYQNGNYAIYSPNGNTASTGANFGVGKGHVQSGGLWVDKWASEANSRVTVSRTIAMLTDNDITIALRYYHSTAVSSPNIFLGFSGAPVGVFLLYTHNSRLFGYFSNGAGTSYNIQGEVASAISTGWHTVIFRRLRGTLSYRCDGLSIVTSASQPPNFDMVFYSSAIGGAPGQNSMTGEIQFIGMWEDALSDADCAVLEAAVPDITQFTTAITGASNEYMSVVRSPVTPTITTITRAGTTITVVGTGFMPDEYSVDPVVTENGSVVTPTSISDTEIIYTTVLHENLTIRVTNDPDELYAEYEFSHVEVKPVIETATPAANKFVWEQLTGYTGEAKHGIWLPAGYNSGETWPCIIEFLGNSDTVDSENSCLGWGITAGVGTIWVVVPWVNPDKASVSTQWWSEESWTTYPDATVDYFKALMPYLQATYNIDYSKTMLTGFSRGGYGAGLIGCYDSTTASYWSKAYCHAGYDSGNYLSTNYRHYYSMQSVGSKPVLLSVAEDEAEGSAAQVQAAADLLGRSRVKLSQVTVAGLTGHYSTWVLAQIGESYYASAQAVRTWYEKTLISPANVAVAADTASEMDKITVTADAGLLSPLSIKIGDSVCLFDKTEPSDTAIIVQPAPGVSTGSQALKVVTAAGESTIKNIEIFSRNGTSDLNDFKRDGCVFGLLPQIAQGSSVIYQGPARHEDIEVSFSGMSGEGYGVVVDGDKKVIRTPGGGAYAMATGRHNLYTPESQFTIALWVKWEDGTVISSFRGTSGTPEGYSSPYHQWYHTAQKICSNGSLYVGSTNTFLGSNNAARQLSAVGTAYDFLCITKTGGSSPAFRIDLNNNTIVTLQYEYQDAVWDWTDQFCPIGTNAGNSLGGYYGGVLFYNRTIGEAERLALYSMGPDLGGNLVLTYDGVLLDKDEKALGTPTFTADEEPVLVTLNEDYVVSKLLGSGSKFDSPLVWDKIIVTYSPPSGTQHKHFTFRPRGNSFKSYTSWVTISTTGTWTLKDMVIVNLSKDYIKLDSSNFTSNDNITVS